MQHSHVLGRIDNTGVHVPVPFSKTWGSVCALARARVPYPMGSVCALARALVPSPIPLIMTAINSMHRD